MRTSIVIPVKSFDKAKGRLGGVMNPEQREALARNLYRRTLTFFRNKFFDYHILVVTDSACAGEIGVRLGASVLTEPEASGLSVAASRAASWNERNGFDAQLLIPADILYLDQNEIRRMLSPVIQTPFVRICPAVDGGTNGLLTKPPSVITFHYGLRSSVVHWDAAKMCGCRCELLHLPHLRFDLDTPDDLSHYFGKVGDWKDCRRDAGLIL